ncbi:MULTISPECIES: tetratricopeptide repeat protein [Alcanivorax]|uniref:YfgM family protein n=1 Tax=Alcanivorax TaxID=59753 RepID=UPI000A486933|nr:tetratricopeptide repeat protein [Alcanivorax sp. NBRC 102028]
MADYMRDEEEQAELLKEWWQKNGTATIITVVLAVAALIGWREWQDHQGEQSAEASKQYQVMVEALTAQEVDEATVNQKAEALKENFPGSAYANYANLAQARLAVQAGDYESAASLLQSVVDDGATDALIYTARLRLVRVLLQQEAYDKAAAELDNSFPSAFNGMALELRGDLAKARGDHQAATDAYTQALETLQDNGEKDRVQMKLDDLKS